MSYKLNDIRDLRIDWAGDHTGGHSASIHFESGTERFHIWLYCPHFEPVEKIDDGDLPFNMQSTLYANDIQSAQFGHRGARKSDLSKPSHRKLRDLIAARIQVKFGNLNAAVRAAAKAYIVDRDEKKAKLRADLADNIRAALNEAIASGYPEDVDRELIDTITFANDETLIAIRGVMYNAKHPEARNYDGRASVAI